MTLLTLAISVGLKLLTRVAAVVGGGKAADSRGELFGSAAGIGDGASAWDFQPAAVRLAQGVSRRSAWRYCRIRAGGDRAGAA